MPKHTIVYRLSVHVGFACVFFLGTTGPAAYAAPRSSASVYFIGHSLIDSPLPELIHRLATAAGKNHRYSYQLIIGAPIVWNWEHAGEGKISNAKTELARPGYYDALVVTEALPILEHLTWSDPIGNSLKFYDLARNANPHIVFYLYETWHEAPNSETADHYIRTIQTERAYWERILHGINRARPSGQRAYMIPAGQAFERLIREISAGNLHDARRNTRSTYYGLDSRLDYLGDYTEPNRVHLNTLGAYFVALVHFATIYRQSPVGLPTLMNFNGGIEGVPASVDPALATKLQQIAWDAVRAYPLSGVTDSGSPTPPQPEPQRQPRRLRQPQER